MESTLIVAQIMFYFAASVAIFAVGILVGIAAYHSLRILQELENLLRNLHEISDEIGENVKSIIENLSSLPGLSYLLRKRSSVRIKKKSGDK